MQPFQSGEKSNWSQLLKTQDENYSFFLLGKRSAWWKKFFNVQLPYRWNLRRLKLGFTLDIGCGLGRNLLHLNGRGVGLDHNSHAVKIAVSRGINAFTPEDFRASPYHRLNLFDSILLSHVAEHLEEKQLEELLAGYLPLLKPGGQVVVITPQELGFRSDPTHVQFMDFLRLKIILKKIGLMPVKEYSFPLPRCFGRIFKYNEFISIGRKV